MIFMRKFLPLVFIVFLTACSVRAPIKGEFNNGDPISGVAVGYLSGNGTIKVETKDGIKCEGEYNALSQAKELTIYLDCQNDLTAKAQVTRDDNLQSGEGTFEMSNGRKGTISFEAK